MESLPSLGADWAETCDGRKTAAAVKTANKTVAREKMRAFMG